MNLCDRTQSVLWNCATARLTYCSHIMDRSLLWISSFYHPNHLVDWIYPSKLKHLNFLLQRITLASLKDKIPWTIICPRSKLLFYILLNFHCSATFVQSNTLSLQTKGALPFSHKWQYHRRGTNLPLYQHTVLSGRTMMTTKYKSSNSVRIWDST